MRGKEKQVIFNLGNLLTMFDESIVKIMKHLEDGYPDRALARARKTHTALEKVINHCVGRFHNEVENKL